MSKTKKDSAKESEPLYAAAGKAKRKKAGVPGRVPRLRFPEFSTFPYWEWVSLGTVGAIITGNTPSNDNLSYYNGSWPFFSPSDIGDSRYIESAEKNLTDEGVKRARIVKANSILFVCIGSTIGKIAQNTIDCATNQQINSLVPFGEYSGDFLYSALENDAKKIAGIAGRQAVPIINKETFSKVRIIVPLYDEQQKIAACLSSLDSLISAHSQKLEAFKTYKRGLMQQLFPAEGETVPRLRFPEFRDAGEWEEHLLGSCIIEPPDYGLNAPAVPYSDELPTYLRITDISEDGCFQSNQKMSVAVAVSPKDYLAKGDIVLARTGASVGKSYQYKPVDGPLVFAGFLIRIRPDEEKLHTNFVSQFFATQRYWKWVAINSTRSGQPGLNGNEYASLMIPMPPRVDNINGSREQQKIASILSYFDILISAQAAKIESLKAHKRGLMQGLFPAPGGAP